VFLPQCTSNKLTRRPSELVQHFRFKGEFASAQERCLTLNCYVLATSLAYPTGEEGGNLLVQMTPNSAVNGGSPGGGRHPVVSSSTQIWVSVF
jgi:hypothetical protein